MFIAAFADMSIIRCCRDGASREEEAVERVLVSRQPIYSAEMSVLGYELLFRDSDVNYASFSDGDQATAEVILNTFTDIGLHEVVGRNLAFINFDRNLIMGSYCELLPPKQVVLELLETVEPDDALLVRLAELKRAGYRIALDDFICADESYRLVEFAHFVKLDIVACDQGMIERSVAALKNFPVRLIAEKVETPEQVKLCQALGFDYFQGYFFCRPELVVSRRLPVNRLAIVRLITKLNNPEIKLRELEEALSQDLSLSYKLLRYTNSAICGLQREIESIRHAAILVGLDKLRVWTSLILFSGMEDKPRDLLVTGVIRARMCQKLAEFMKMSHPERSFLVGLFSVLDAVFDRPLAEILEPLPLAPNIAAALLRCEGQLGSILQSVLAYEQRNWTEARGSLKLNLEVMGQVYQEAVIWSLRNLSALSEGRG
jgi:EAL and modified HD-GYP domain-containing signal transduction protein